jgi:hypothetical protein
VTLIPRTTGQPARTLNSAVDDLHGQVADLLNPRRQRFTRSRKTPAGGWVEDGPTEHVTVPSLWRQLRAALGNSRTLTAGGGRPGSKLPLDAGALDVAEHITAEVNRRVLELGLTPRLRQDTTVTAPSRLQLLPAGRWDDEDRTPWHDPQRSGQVAERLAGTRAAVTDRANAARIVDDLPANLRQLALAVVATRDLTAVDKLADQVHSWVRSCESALAMEEEGTETRGILTFPCPDCRSVWVTRDSAGEPVQEPAIVAVFRDHLVRNFTCRACQALWWRGEDIEALTRSAHSWRNPVPTHHVTFTIEKNYIRGLFKCTAEPGADCRLICPEQCEAWPCGHKLVDGGECNVMTWLGLSDPVESYAGDEEPLRSGPISASWDGADMTWEYAEPAVVVQVVGEDPSVQIAREAASA